jgi:hypothetical protein
MLVLEPELLLSVLMEEVPLLPLSLSRISAVARSAV